MVKFEEQKMFNCILKLGNKLVHFTQWTLVKYSKVDEKLFFGEETPTEINNISKEFFFCRNL